jgi:hypothetical protein
MEHTYEHDEYDYDHSDEECDYEQEHGLHYDEVSGNHEITEYDSDDEWTLASDNRFGRSSGRSGPTPVQLVSRKTSLNLYERFGLYVETVHQARTILNSHHQKRMQELADDSLQKLAVIHAEHVVELARIAKEHAAKEVKPVMPVQVRKTRKGKMTDSDIKPEDRLKMWEKERKVIQERRCARRRENKLQKKTILMEGEYDRKAVAPTMREVTMEEDKLQELEHKRKMLVQKGVEVEESEEEMYLRMQITEAKVETMMVQKIAVEAARNLDIKTEKKVVVPRAVESVDRYDLRMWREMMINGTKPKVYKRDSKPQAQPVQDESDSDDDIDITAIAPAHLRPKPVTKPKTTSKPKVNKHYSKPKPKTLMCESVDTGRPCRRGEKCRFAHSVDELAMCQFGTQCKFVELCDGKWVNVTEKICTFRHSGENDSSYRKRTMLTFKTRMCDFVDTGRPCRHGEKCRFAHSIDELAMCQFGTECKFVELCDGKWVNVTEKICTFRHSGENDSSYRKRTMRTRAVLKNEYEEQEYKETAPVIHKEQEYKETAPVIHKEQERKETAPVSIKVQPRKVKQSVWCKPPTIEAEPIPVSYVRVDVARAPVQECCTRDERIHGREMLMDKSKVIKNKTKTRMCNSVGTGLPCRHGANCRFAHSVDELTVAKCFFAHSCRCVRWSGEHWINHGEKLCTYLHPGESEDVYYKRIGKSNPKAKQTSKPVVSKPVVSKPVVSKPVVSKPVVSKPIVSKPVVSKPVVSKPVVSKPVVSKPVVSVVDEETILCTDEKMAFKAIQAALRAGKTTIRIKMSS